MGSRVDLYPNIVKRQYDEGHFIASHGYSHVYEQIYASPQSVLDEYNKSLTSIRNAIGAPEYNAHLFSTILSNNNKKNKTSNDTNAYISYTKKNDSFF